MHILYFFVHLGVLCASVVQRTSAQTLLFPVLSGENNKLLTLYATAIKMYNLPAYCKKKYD